MNRLSRWGNWPLTLEVLDHEVGPKALFSGEVSRQISADYYWSAGGKPVLVKDLASAQRALQIVIHQGEGRTTSLLDDGDHQNFGQPYEVAHFYRFKEISCRQRYKRGDDPAKDPTGADLSVDYAQVYPTKTDAKHGDYAQNSVLASLNLAFNRQYSLMLRQLEEALNGEPKTLYTAIMNGMHNLSSLALEMVALPIADEHGPTGSPTFEWVEV